MKYSIGMVGMFMPKSPVEQSTAYRQFMNNAQLAAEAIRDRNPFALWQVYKLITTPPPNVDVQSQGPWRPPQWKNLPSDQKQLMYIKTNIANDTTAYFFDAILREEHTTQLKVTEHPVQTGANIADHAFMQPARLVMEIGMSDAMDSLIPGQFNQAYTKSVSAYRTLLALQQSRVPLQVLTRLNLYQNMVIEQINAPDDYKTLHGLRCTVTMRQLIVGTVSTTTVSARPQATGQTNVGVVNPEPVDNGSILYQAGT